MYRDTITKRERKLIRPMRAKLVLNKGRCKEEESFLFCMGGFSPSFSSSFLLLCRKHLAPVDGKRDPKFIFTREKIVSSC